MIAQCFCYGRAPCQAPPQAALASALPSGSAPRVLRSEQSVSVGEALGTRACFILCSVLLQRERSSCDQSTRPAVRRPGSLHSWICQRWFAVLVLPNTGALREPFIAMHGAFWGSGAVPVE